MSVISNLFAGLSGNKVLPSAKERKGMRVLAPEGALTDSVNNLDAYQRFPEEVSNLISKDRQADLENLQDKDLNLFALNGPENLAGYLDSDAVTGAGTQELGDLASQLELSSPDATGSLNSLWSLPGAMQDLNSPSVVNGISAVSKLARLYSMLAR